MHSFVRVTVQFAVRFRRALRATGEQPTSAGRGVEARGGLQTGTRTGRTPRSDGDHPRAHPRPDIPLPSLRTVQEAPGEPRADERLERDPLHAGMSYYGITQVPVVVVVALTVVRLLHCSAALLFRRLHSVTYL